MARGKLCNAKDELVRAVNGRTVEYGYVTHEHYARPDEAVTVRFGGSEEYLAALAKLDFEYDDGFGSQELYGTVVFEDGSWLERDEYDGSEWWRNCARPTREDVMCQARGE